MPLEIGNGRLRLPVRFTRHDRDCLKFALENGVEAVSQSFVEKSEDIDAVRDAARPFGYDPFVIAKIERSRALNSIEQIIDAADGIMIARGDLGVLNFLLNRFRSCKSGSCDWRTCVARPVITATQMLESMTSSPRPTRAEATDVANAVLDGTHCVMLFGESAVGSYPVEAVSILARIAAATELHKPPIHPKDLFEGIDLKIRCPQPGSPTFLLRRLSNTRRRCARWHLQRQDRQEYRPHPSARVDCRREFAREHLSPLAVFIRCSRGPRACRAARLECLRARLGESSWRGCRRSGAGGGAGGKSLRRELLNGSDRS
jgi:hypothetical protein